MKGSDVLLCFDPHRWLICFPIAVWFSGRASEFDRENLFNFFTRFVLFKSMIFLAEKATRMDYLYFSCVKRGEDEPVFSSGMYFFSCLVFKT